MWRSCIHILLKSGLSKDRFAAGLLMEKEISPEDFLNQ